MSHSAGILDDNAVVNDSVVLAMYREFESEGRGHGVAPLRAKLRALDKRLFSE